MSGKSEVLNSTHGQLFFSLSTRSFNVNGNNVAVQVSTLMKFVLPLLSQSD